MHWQQRRHILANVINKFLSRHVNKLTRCNFHTIMSFIVCTKYSKIYKREGSIKKMEIVLGSNYKFI